MNSLGYRSPEPRSARLPSMLRVACVGDSWTFGMNVDQDRTYPSRLGEQLRHAYPDKTIEVLNFGVLGYSSFQGLQLMKARILALQPDVVAIGFAMNDSEVAGYRDQDMVATMMRPATN
jgi:lysophospholipase L1-like esterase